MAIDGERVLRTIYKPALFGMLGAVGCVVGAIAGEVLLAATQPISPPPPPPQAVCLLIDCSGSMQGSKLEEVKDAAKQFVRRQDLSRGTIGVVEFESQAKVACSLEKNKPTIERSLEQLSSRGGTKMELGLQLASDLLRSASGKRAILLFTDGMPDRDDPPRVEARAVRDQGIQLVAIGTGDAKTGYLGQLTGDDKLVFPTQAGNFGVAFQKAEEVIYKPTLVESGAREQASIPSLLRIGGWTAMLAVALCLSLIMGQNSYLRRQLLPLGSALKGGVGSLVAGLVAGAVGQAIFQATTVPASWLEPVSRAIGWVILGGLLGWGMAFFVPNLNSFRALLGGGIGGAIGAVGFLIAAATLGQLPARLAGAACLGFLIGLMVALVELGFRKAWLEIKYGPREIRTVSLGAEPVTIGSDTKRCTIYVPNSAQVALRYRVDRGTILCEDVATGQVSRISAGDRKLIGSVELSVCTSGDSGYVLRLTHGQALQLKEGNPLIAGQIPGLQAGGADGVVADVSRNPSDPSVLGLRNRSLQTWVSTTPDGAVKPVEPGRSLKMAVGTKVNFGNVQGEFTL